MALKDKKGKKMSHKNLEIIEKYRVVRVRVNNKIKIKKKMIKLVQVKNQFKRKKLARGIKRKTIIQ